MPRAEVGSTKYLSNKLKSKGLQRLRWYCQPCQRQMRDENGFKCHCQSESHVRQMLLIGEDPNKAINDFSKQFEHDFLQQLRTSHGTKPIHINHFYQEYIGNKEHIHMNATKWSSLTEFAKYLGKEGLCRVEETDKGLHIAWVDNSPEALKRQDAIRKKERMDKGDEEREQRLIEEQVKRAQDAAKQESELYAECRILQRAEGEKISLNFGTKPTTTKLPTPPKTSDEEASGDDGADPMQKETSPPNLLAPDLNTDPPSEPGPAAVKMSLGASSTKPKNVFSSKTNPLSGKKSAVVEQPKKMSEAERIMKEEIERKRARENNATVTSSVKKQKVQ